MSSNRALRPVCFVAMPFGQKSPPGKSEPLIDFDAVFEHIETVVTQLGLECIRADVELSGGFVQGAMYERLLVAEYVIADLTFSNPNVTYEVGVRHGASSRPTILIGALRFFGNLPFDFKPLRVLPYDLADDGSLPEDKAGGFRAALQQRLHAAVEGELPVDNPIMQVTSWTPSGRLEHDKTDVYLSRMRFCGHIGEEIAAALNKASDTDAVKALQAIETRIFQNTHIVAELHSALLGIYIGYRERKAHRKMIELYGRLPNELCRTAVVQEQLALALNRLAEQAEREAGELEKAGEDSDAEKLRNQAHEHRQEALAALDRLRAPMVSSETWGIRGRICKGQYQAELNKGNELKAEASLGKAIEAYWSGVKADMRDYYPGVNCVTLSLLRGSAEDLKRLETLVPVVRQAVEFAPEAKSEEERYWNPATKLEMASAGKDWQAARRHLVDCLKVEVPDWMRETTIDNLEIHLQAFKDDSKAVEKIQELIGGLQPST
ncbi:MAG TPA: TRAFs-binding domain-containing protein [Acidobacteriota bacterium]|nr:TRAFs-binding domain-containing protein [Acidobacteriota bacterium]